MSRAEESLVKLQDETIGIVCVCVAGPDGGSDPPEDSLGLAGSAWPQICCPAGSL